MRARTTTALVLAAAASLAASTGSAQASRGFDCLPGTPAATDIVLLSQYGGSGLSTPYRLGPDDSPRVVFVTGDPGRPIILVLAAYESIVWDLSRVPQGRIRGVYASGFKPQGVSGLPAMVPIRTTHGQVDGDVCGTLSFGDDGGSVAASAAVIRRSFGRYPVEYFGARKTASFDLSGGDLRTFQEMPSARTIVSDVPVSITGIRSGAEGLDDLQAAGAIVPVSQGDLRYWIKMGATFTPLGRLDMELSRGSPTGRATPPWNAPTYLVVRSLRHIPDDLYGSQSVSFILMPGVTVPPIPPTAHSSFHRISGFTGTPPLSGAGNAGISMRRDTSDVELGQRLRHIRWRLDGSLISETLATGQERNRTTPREREPIGRLTEVPTDGVLPFAAPSREISPDTRAILDNAVPDADASTAPRERERRLAPVLALSAAIVLMIAAAAAATILRLRRLRMHETTPMIHGRSSNDDA